MRHDPAQIDDTASPPAAGGADKERPGLKARAVEEIKKFWIIVGYLWVLFALFSLHKTIILEQNHINYQEQTFAIVNALVLAKVMLIADGLKLGSHFRDYPLIYPVLHKSFVFAVVLIGFHIVEHAVTALLRGGPLSDSIAEFGVGNLKGILVVGAIMFVALIPFFMYREVARVVGINQLWQLIFARGRRTFTLMVGE